MVLILLVCTIFTSMVVFRSGSAKESLNKNAFVRATAGSPLIDTLDNVFGFGSAFNTRGGYVAGTQNHSDGTGGYGLSTSWGGLNRNEDSLFYKMLYEPPVTLISKALMGIGAGIVLIVIYIKIIQEAQRGDPTLDFWFKVFVTIAIAFFAIAFLDDIFVAIDNLGRFVVDKIRFASKTAYATADLQAVSEKIWVAVEKVGVSSMRARIMVNLYILIITIVQYIPVIIAHIAAFGIMFELGIRRALAPLAISSVVAEGFRSAGIRYFKKFFAIYVRIGIFYALAVLCTKVTLTAWESTLKLPVIEEFTYEGEISILTNDVVPWMEAAGEAWAGEDGSSGYINVQKYARALNNRFRGNEAWNNIYKQFQSGNKDTIDFLERTGTQLYMQNGQSGAMSNVRNLAKDLRNSLEGELDVDVWDVMTLIFKMAMIVAAINLCGGFMILRSRGLADEVAGANR